MIHRVFSSLDTFKELGFGSGLNIVAAVTTPESSERQTRNRAGKSSLVEIVHFLLGAEADPSTLARNPALEPYEFGLDLDVGPSPVQAVRTGSSPSKVGIRAGDTGGWPVQPQQGLLDNPALTNTEWKRVLGDMWFGLGELDHQGAPSFRTLISYFARREHAGGFGDPLRHYSNQNVGQQQVAISYLLGFDWTISARLEAIRQRQAAVRQARSRQSNPVGELRTRLAIGREALRETEEAVSNFRVLPTYSTLEVEASELTQRLNANADKNVADRRLMTRLQLALDHEEAPAGEDLEAVYREAGVALPDATLRRFDEVRDFHMAVISNRQSYLRGEITSAEARIAARTREMEDVDRRRAEVFAVLQSGGALEEYAALQQELVRRQREVESIRAAFADADELDQEDAEIEAERNQLALRLRQDFSEQSDRLNRAILAFESASRYLYEEGGSLNVEATATGPRFEVRIRGGASRGVTNMQVFCFDMMLTQMVIEQGLGPRFLIHDSHLFDGVDERQIARALEYGALMADQVGFQYIVTMNSDVLEGAALAGYDASQHQLPVVLTDETDDGGLFGFRF